MRTRSGVLSSSGRSGGASLDSGFYFPLRLFVEAKALGRPVGLSHVRNAVGVIEDVNQKYTRREVGRRPLRCYSYRYALFSTSSFTGNAADFALAHQVSLIDLGGPSFHDLRQPWWPEFSGGVDEAVGRSEDFFVGMAQ